MQMMRIQHGDYIRVAIPPFKHEQVPTRLAVQCAQAGFSPQQTLRRYQQRGDDTDSLYSMISAAQSTGDATAFFQLHCTSSGDAPSTTWTQAHPQAFAARPTDDDPRPSWISQMHAAFTEEACTEFDEEGPVAYVETWFVKGYFAHVSEHSKTFRLTQEIAWWRDELIELWRDKIDLHRPVQIYWVQPTPITSSTRERLGHIILCQDVNDFLAPALLTVEFHADDSYRFGQAAAMLPNPVTVFDIKHLARLARHCSSRRCTLRHGRQFWSEHEARRFSAGAGLTFGVLPPIRDLHVGSEHVSSPSLEPSNIHGQDEEEDIIPAQPPLHDQSLFTRKLFELWDRQAVFGPAHLERLLRVETWYLEGRHVKHHDEQRNVMLAEDYWTWEGILTHRWRDFVLPGIDVDFTIVTPTPSSAPPLEIHIILHQRVFEFDRPSIVTVRDNAVLRGHAYTAAVLLPSAVTKADIILRMGKTFSCPPQRPDAVCTCWHGALEVEDFRPFPNRDGFAFDLHVHRQLPVGFWSDEEEDTGAAASTSLLQSSLQARRAPLQEQIQPEEEPPADPVRADSGSLSSETQWIDMAPAIRQYEWIDTHFFLPQFDVPNLPECHAAWEWIQHWWDPSQPCFQLCIYTDGSFSKAVQEQEAPGGAAVAAFVLQPDGWRFAGALSSALGDATNAYVSELSAITVAIKFAYDIIKVNVAGFGFAPSFVCRHDATTVGRQADGSWQCISCPLLGKTLRSIVLLVEHAFDVIVKFEHIKGHSGEPGNELVDFLADAARVGQALTPFDEWLGFISQRHFVEAVQWVWLIVAPDFAACWQEQSTAFPPPQTTPHPDLLPVSETHNESRRHK